MGNPGNFRILLRHALHGVNDEYGDIRPLHRRHRADNHIAFQFFLNFIFSPKPGRINKHVLFAIVRNLRVYGISGRPGNIRNDQTVFPDQAVDDRGFSHVRFPDDGHLDAVILLFVLRLLSKMGNHLVQKLSETETVCGRYRVRLPDPQIIKLIDVRHIFLEIVHFIDRQNHGFVGTSEHIGHLGIRILQPLFHVHHKDDHIRRIYGNLRLFPHLGQDNVLALRLNAARINQCKIPVKPRDVRVNPVSGDARRVLYDRYIFTSQRVKQGGFSHIRSSHHSHNRLGLFFTHVILSILLWKPNVSGYSTAFYIQRTNKSYTA